MRILVLGGTGFIGREVLRALANHELFVLHRGTRDVTVENAEMLIGDMRDLAPIRKRLHLLQPDVVLDMQSRNAADACHVIDTLRGAAARSVVVSSGSVYASFGVLCRLSGEHVDNSPRAESAPLRQALYPYRGVKPRAPDDPFRWLDDYDKIEVEREYLSAAGMQASVIRLPMVYGPGDPDGRLISYWRQMFDSQEPILLHRAAAAWRNSRAHVLNAAQAVALVVVRGKQNRIYNVAEEQDFPEAEWVRLLGGAVGWTGRVDLTASIDEVAARPRISELPSNSNFAQHLRMSSERIRLELGYSESISLDEGLALCVADARRRL